MVRDGFCFHHFGDTVLQCRLTRTGDIHDSNHEFIQHPLTQRSSLPGQGCNYTTGVRKTSQPVNCVPFPAIWRVARSAACTTCPRDALLLSVSISPRVSHIIAHGPPKLAQRGWLHPRMDSRISRFHQTPTWKRKAQSIIPTSLEQTYVFQAHLPG